MGISFDLSVEDLPDGIFDAIVAAGYHKQDPYTIGRWDGIEPLRDSWIVNDIQVANNTVLICGSYLARWDSFLADENAGSPPDNQKVTYAPQDMAQQNQDWRDGFFAAVSFDWIDNLAAWHLVCTRSALELGPAISAPADPALTEGGLYSMVIDQRTFAGSVFENSPTPSEYSQFMYITAVGYTAVGNLDISGYNYLAAPPPFDEAAYTPYQYSVFENQDYYPQMFSFVVCAQESTIDSPGDTWTPTGRENPLIDPKTGQPIQDPNLPLKFEGVASYVESLSVGVADKPQDQLGQTIHLQMFDVSTLTMNVGDWSNNYYFWYDVAFGPLEQYTYRGHQIGYNELPASGVVVAAPYGRLLPGYNFYCPTPTVSMAPVIKPIEFTMSVPGFQIYSDGIQEYPYHPENVRRSNPPFQPFIDSDAHIWRHGFIPRKLKTIYRTQAIFDQDNTQSFPPGENDALGTLVIGGECLVQDYDIKNRPIAGQAKSTGGVLNYEPLLLYGQNGFPQDINQFAGPNQNKTDIGVFFAFTKRNFCIEDVTATGTVNSSLDNASIELIAPCLEINLATSNYYAVVLCVQITDPEPRAEIMMFQANVAGCAGEPFNFVQDYKVVGPYASKGGVWETATGIELGTTWHNVGAQPDPFTEYQLSLPSNVENIKTYSNKDLDPYNSTAAQTGRSIILGGNTTRRTPNGTWAVAYDTGSLNADFSFVFNTRSPPTPTIPNNIGFAVLKVSKYTDSTPAYAPQELDYYYEPTNTQTFQQTYKSRLYHIPNDSIQYPVNALPAAPGWNWRTPSSNQLLINNIGFGLTFAGATIPPPSGFYYSLSELATQLNDELAYIKSAGPPFNQPTPVGVEGISFAVTSDGKGVYAQTDPTYFNTTPFGIVDPTFYQGELLIEDSFGQWNTQDNYPYTSDPVGVGTIKFPWDLSGQSTEGNTLAATVEHLRGQDFSGCFLDIGELLDNSLNPPKPITVGSERFFMSADYDNDRDQWLISLTDITEKFTVLASTTDFSEILDQTASIEQLPSQRNEALLLALNQKTNALDGVAFAGNYVPIHGVTNQKAYKITGTTGRTVKVFLNYMLYDGLDSMIAVELSNLGLGVTPENVLWYKTTIMNADADQEVTLEEIESWMDLQRQQYQEMLKNRKPIQRDSGSEPKVDDYILDDKSIADLLPELDRLPPNPDSNPTDADMMGNTLSGDIQSVEEKRRESDV